MCGVCFAVASDDHTECFAGFECLSSSLLSVIRVLSIIFTVPGVGFSERYRKRKREGDVWSGELSDPTESQ